VTLRLKFNLRVGRPISDELLVVLNIELEVGQFTPPPSFMDLLSTFARYT